MISQSLPTPDEQTFLEDLVTTMLATQRPPDDDGVTPPPMLDIIRVKRPTKKNPLPLSPRNTRLVTLRIQATLLIQYEQRCGRTEAYDTLAQMGLAKSAVATTVPLFTDPREFDYNPYGRQAPTAKEVQQTLKARGIGWNTTLLPHERVKTVERETFECLNGFEHPRWQTFFIAVWYNHAGCPACYDMNRGRLRKKAYPQLREQMSADEG